ncbi:MAG: Na/Pi cotransporter family protein [Lentisphaeria bacterium]|nr:Na/Pi cotransporter family protein [Lentisphaeria bacterium]
MNLIFGLLGGLALFVFGMRTMSQGFAAAAGPDMRRIIATSTRGRITGVVLGSLSGFLVQSSASVVLFVGFINAGLMSLGQSIAPMLGANVGTTLSLQLISFNLSDYCLLAVFAGFVLNVAVKKPFVRNGGLALLGFGILFLGMTIMSDSVRPHRDLFAPWLSHVDGSTLSGLVAGTMAAALITGVVQSSGAVIGMGFALVSAGAITSFEGIFPIIIGANIGTCVTGLLASVGTTISARRIAVAHLLFNVISTGLAMAAAPLFYRFIPLTSGDIIHQAANANTIKMAISALCFLPFASLYAKLVAFLTPSNMPEPTPSFLDPALSDRPEQAIFACFRELRRTAQLCAESLRLAAPEFLKHDPKLARTIKTNEESINAVKDAMGDYVVGLTRHYLSRRQVVLIEHIERCMSDLERIGDHIANLVDRSERQRTLPAARFGAAETEDWLAVHGAVLALLTRVAESLNPETANFRDVAEDILDRRKTVTTIVQRVQQAHFERMENAAVTPVAGMLFNAYLASFARMTKHIKNIALTEQHPKFWLKPEKLARVMSDDAPGYALPGEIDPETYLKKLRTNPSE